MHIIAVLNDGKILETSCKSTRTIGRLRYKIAKKLNVPKDGIMLFSDGTELFDENVLVMWKDIIRPIVAVTILYRSIDHKFNITLRNMNAHKNNIICDDTITIAEIKSIYNVISGGVPIEQVKFIYGSQHLQNNKTLRDYNINSDVVIHVILSFRGD